METQGDHLVSILMPTHRSGPATSQHRLRFKNLLGLAEKRLRDAGLRQPDIDARLEPALALRDDGLFWSHQGRGLAMFLAPGESHLLRLPLTLPELAVVSPRFHVKPLLPLIQSDGSFYLLTVSRKHVRLFQGSRYGLVEMAMENLPGSLGDALRGEDPQRQLQFHTGPQGPGGSRRRAAVFHGHGAGADDMKARTLHYFHKVDAAIRSLLAGEDAPLVVAAVDYLQPLYAEANSYPSLAAWLTGSPGRWSTSQLHRLAWEAVQPVFVEARHQAADRYRQLEGTRLRADTLEVVLPAAHHGRVDSLFVAVGVHRWGRYDAQLGEISLNDQEEPGNEDLLDLAALQTFLNGGTVYAVAPDGMPGSEPLAAILRWEDQP